MKRLACVLVAIVMMAALPTISAGCNRGVAINVFNWGDYIDEDVLQEFTRQTGIRVNYDTYATNEDMYAKIVGGGSNYDIIFPSDYMIEKMIAEDLLETLDYDNIPNISYIDPRFMDQPYDPGNRYSVPYMWGTFGILYNTTMVDETVDSWSILWDAKYANSIFMYDSMRDTMGVALQLAGFSINTRNTDELVVARDMLIAQKPIVRAYVGDPVKHSMIGGEAALAIVYSGDAMYCIELNEDLDYVVPNEGGNIWFDAIAIPKGSQHKEEAEMFINFLCDPDIGLMNTEYIGYSTVNSASFSMLPLDWQRDTVYWPPEHIVANAEILLDLGDFIWEYERLWLEVLAAR